MFYVCVFVNWVFYVSNSITKWEDKIALVVCDWAKMLRDLYCIKSKNSERRDAKLLRLDHSQISPVLYFAARPEQGRGITKLWIISIPTLETRFSIFNIYHFSNVMRQDYRFMFSISRNRCKQCSFEIHFPEMRKLLTLSCVHLLGWFKRARSC